MHFLPQRLNEHQVSLRNSIIKMKRTFLYSSFLLLSFPAFSQTGQLSISRIDQMPNLPSPFLIRDWKTVALNYDSFVFNTTKTGQYLPLTRTGSKGQFNYPDNLPIFMDSYVGSTSHSDAAEAINILPAIVGASLAGIDKSNQNGMNWVSMTKDFFNLKNGQNVYLNGYSTTSGNDWWYDLMPNVYFYQLRSLYPDTSTEIHSQFISVADQWLSCVNKLGGSTIPWTLPNMNYRAFNLATGLPLNNSVPEPESAGSISWILYNAYLQTGNKKYFEGAQLAMDFLTGFPTDPSYEIQLPYGTLIAARMNAVDGTNYPLQKLLDWCFDHSSPLRGWGSIIGNWGGYDVSGLIGEANDAGNDYAFVMNGFQQAAALAPLPKYDKRYAREIAKWLLNVTNASRLFYWNGLLFYHQDSYSWAVANDPQACIPYESMKQKKNGLTPLATGDAIGGGWSATNLSLYSGSSVGYLGAVVSQTNVPEILQIDLNKTDFYGDNALPAFMYFNPTAVSKQIAVVLPSGTFGVYEAITENVMFARDSVSLQFTIPANEVRLIRLYPAGVVPHTLNGRLYAGDQVLDYHYNYSYSTPLRIKSLSGNPNPVIIDSAFTVFCEPGNVIQGDSIKFEWFMNDSLLPGQNSKQLKLTAPSYHVQQIIKCRISDKSLIAEDTIRIHVLSHIPAPPVILSIHPSMPYTPKAGINNFTAIVKPAAGDTLTYSWRSNAGSLIQTSGSTVNWQAPDTLGIASITVKVTNQDSLSTTFSTGLLVKDIGLLFQTPLIWYPFDTDSKNAIANQFHATVSGATKTEDARGAASLAYRFTSGQNIIYTNNDPALNFTNAVSISCWVKCETLGSERFVISHGSWQQRYKLSITPTGYLRWTVKTDAGVCDLDGSGPIDLNRYYHVTCLYTGYSMELYVDGTLDSFKPFSGSILASTKPITIGRMDNIETQYALLGSVDEVKIWDKEIPVSQIAQLKNEWLTATGINSKELISRIYPNPSNGVIYIEIPENSSIENIALYSMNGALIQNYSTTKTSELIMIRINQPSTGLYLLQIILKDGRRISKKIILL
jgi:hypothetical protein